MSAPAEPSSSPVATLAVLAAVARAVLHRPAHPGVSAAGVLDQLSLAPRTTAARAVHARLGELEQAGLLERVRHRGLERWRPTPAGLGFLERARGRGEGPSLPESPQHRRWLTARRSAAFEIARLRDALAAGLRDAARLLAAEPPPHSDAWFDLAERLHLQARALGSASHCLYEWREPDDDGADEDERAEPSDRLFEGRALKRRRALRAGRRNVRLWQPPG